MTGRRLLAVALLLVTTSCTKVYNPSPTSPSTVDPAPTPVVLHRLEYRVEGVLGFDTQTAQVTYGNATDGTSAVLTQLPWIVTEQVAPSAAGLYVYLSAVAEGSSQVKVQILVDGVVFREASGFSPSLSGTIRF